MMEIFLVKENFLKAKGKKAGDTSSRKYRNSTCRSVYGCFEIE
jgi:hypothetical protein